MTIKEEIDRAAPILHRVNEAIRENPLAAGLIGAGVAWMLFGAKGFGAMSGIAKGAGDKVGSFAKGAGSVVADAGNAMLNASSTVSSGVKSATSDVAGAVASIVPDFSVPDSDAARKLAADTGTAINERFSAMTSSGREYGAAIQSRLSETLEQQPLLLGALGLAIGAGIASTFATTDIESEWIGEKGAATREQLQGAADEVKVRARKIVDDVQDEAAQQGLTVDAAKDVAKSVASKVGNVASTARDSVAQPFK